MNPQPENSGSANSVATLAPRKQVPIMQIGGLIHTTVLSLRSCTILLVNKHEDLMNNSNMFLMLLCLPNFLPNKRGIPNRADLSRLPKKKHDGRQLFYISNSSHPSF